MKQSEINAAIIKEIYLGIAMARAAGIQCGNPQNIRIQPIKTKDAPK